VRTDGPDCQHDAAHPRVEDQSHTRTAPLVRSVSHAAVLPLWTGRQQIVSFDAGLLPILAHDLTPVQAAAYGPTLRVATAVLHAIGEEAAWERFTRPALAAFTHARATGASEADAVSAAVAAVLQAQPELAPRTATPLIPPLTSHACPCLGPDELFSAGARR
jgi:hypothetical protein